MTAWLTVLGADLRDQSLFRGDFPSTPPNHRSAPLIRAIEPYSVVFTPWTCRGAKTFRGRGVQSIWEKTPFTSSQTRICQQGLRPLYKLKIFRISLQRQDSSCWAHPVSSALPCFGAELKSESFTEVLSPSHLRKMQFLGAEDHSQLQLHLSWEGKSSQISRHGVKDLWNHSICSKIEEKLEQVIGEGDRLLFALFHSCANPAKERIDSEWKKLQIQWRVSFWKMQLLPVENLSV